MHAVVAGNAETAGDDRDTLTGLTEHGPRYQTADVDRPCCDCLLFCFVYVFV